MNILIMGGPGAGKGSLSAKLIEVFNYNHISTGDIFRSVIRSKTELGIKAKEYMDQGLFVPDEVTNPMVKNYLASLNNDLGYLLDGYPRTINQAQAFDELTKGSTLAIDKVLVLDIAFETLTSRITGRRICKECGAIYHMETLRPKVEGVCDKCGGVLYQRKDDTVESLKTRLNDYRTLTEPVLAYYEAQGIVSHINADQNIDSVWDDALQALEAK